MKHRRVRRIGIAAVGTAWHNHADRRLLYQHHPCLHRARMRAQDMPLPITLTRDVERVMHLPGGMIGGNVQFGKIVVVVFDVGTLRHREAKIGKDGGDFVLYLADRMNKAARLGTRRQGHVDPLERETRIENLSCERGLASADRHGNPVAQAVEQRPVLAPLLGTHLAQRFQ